ncbi:MAG TPA: aminotransferase class I/II-fold pyridoxal phosphate-dependent enzyme [Acidimicrobiia bacterium]|jgi:dTDP-4-amino-4,6-dideoxygalactose transaminase
MARIHLSEPAFRGNEDAYVREAVASSFVAGGPFLGRFEAAFANRVDAPYAVACASGTAAIHLALVALGVRPGDEVWVSDLTFVASANPARYCGARVTLVDSEPESWNLDPYVVAEELDRRAACGEAQPAAIVAVHLLGHPARLDVLLVAAAEHGVPVVEDAAESLGATWTGGPLAGREVGTVGTIGCFSFNGNKLVTSGGGGMLVTANEALAAHARHLSTQAKLPGVGYAHDEIGFNYRLSNLSAALGLAQFEQVDAFLARRREIADRYDAAFSRVPGLAAAPDRPWARRSGWLSSVVCADPTVRERIRLALEAGDVEARPVWAPLRHQAPYRGAPVLGGDVAVQLGDRVLNLPSSVTLTDEQQQRVIDVVLRAASTAAA